MDLTYWFQIKSYWLDVSLPRTTPVTSVCLFYKEGDRGLALEFFMPWQRVCAQGRISELEKAFGIIKGKPPVFWIATTLW